MALYCRKLHVSYNETATASGVVLQGGRQPDNPTICRSIVLYLGNLSFSYNNTLCVFNSQCTARVRECGVNDLGHCQTRQTYSVRGTSGNWPCVLIMNVNNWCRPINCKAIVYMPQTGGSYRAPYILKQQKKAIIYMF